MLRTSLTDLLAIDVPVVGAPMAGVSGGTLAAAVTAGGGLGMIGVGNTTPPEWISAEAGRAREADTVYTRAFDVALGLGWPPGYGGRALANEFSRRWAGREDELAAARGAREELSAARKRGDYDIAYQYAGQGVGLVREERPAAEVVAGLAAGAERLLSGWG